MSTNFLLTISLIACALAGALVGWVACAYWHELKPRVTEVKAVLNRQDELDRIAQSELFDRRLSATKAAPSGVVYFIAPEGRDVVKIGYTTGLAKRLDSLQTSNPDKLTVILTIDGTEELESALHQRFKASNLRGEWFRLDLPVQQYINEMKERHPD